MEGKGTQNQEVVYQRSALLFLEEVCAVTASNENRPPHRFRVKLLFGLFEADATGTVAIVSALVLFGMMGVGRLFSLW